MSSLVDHQIKHLATNFDLIQPFNPDQLNPGSYDVLLGDTILVEEKEDKPYYETDEQKRWISYNIAQKPYFMHPNEFILAHTAEFIKIPDYLEAIFCLKSSRGREGWNHALAAYIDSGFHGRVTLELKNYNRYQILKVEAGMRIGQLRFTTMDDFPDKTYQATGRYNNAISVEFSKG